MTLPTQWSARIFVLLILSTGALWCAGLAVTAQELAGTSPAGDDLHANTSAPPPGTPPAGLPPNGTSPGTPPDGTSQGGMMNGTLPQGGMNGTAPGGSSGPSCTLSGVYTFDNETATEENGTYLSDATDVSAVYVTNGGDLTLLDPTIETSGNTTSNDDSSFYGLNAAVLATANSTVTIVGGSITTGGTGANGAFPTGSGAAINLTNVTINATGDGGHGVMATSGGLLTLADVNITTSGANSAPLATDRGSGTVNVTGGTVSSSGRDSPGIYSTGLITVDGTNITATGSEAAVIEGSNTITLTNATLTGSQGSRDRGIMIYQSMSGDAEMGPGTFSMTGGSYNWTSTTGPAFYVTNTNATINLTGVNVTNGAAELLNASAGDWGTTGSNGGDVLFTAENETLNGSLVSDGISSITAVLQNGTALSGAIDTAALSLDETSIWNVTGDSVLSTLSDAGGISGTAIANIIGNGHTVTYDAGLAGNRELGGLTYSLANGGSLVPA